MPLHRDIARAAQLLREGGLVAFPTETVYGLGADACNGAAVARIYAAKARPADHPLIVHLPDGAPLEPWADDVSSQARTLAQRFWPGPLTLILARRRLPALAVTGGQNTIGLRVPAHDVALSLLRAFDGGVAAPSANRFGGLSPTRAEHVRRDLGQRVDLILDGGACPVGVESTIVDCSGAHAEILRPGGVTREALEDALQVSLPVRARAEHVRAPGLLDSHYAPRAELLLVPNALALRAEMSRVRELGQRVFALVRQRDADEIAPEECAVVSDDDGDFARALYDTLHALDARGAEVIITTLPLEAGLGLAIADRLRRAAGPRTAG
jgi:L-threonylcarbamoyladenylate synthase